MAEKKILVHLHLFYHNQIDYVISKLRNITNCKWDLYVTFCDENEKSFLKLKRFKPDVIFFKVKNLGYDVYPFIQVLRKVNLCDYDYVLKLHTKSPQKIFGFFKSYRWRNNMFDGLLESKKQFLKALNVIENPKNGLLASHYRMLRFTGLVAEEGYMLNEMMKRLGLHYRGNIYVSGTMFLARAALYKDLANSDINDDDFAKISHTGSNSTNAHVLERVLSLIVYDKGYDCVRINSLKLFLDNARIKLFSVSFVWNNFHHGLAIYFLGKKHLIDILKKNDYIQGTELIKQSFTLNPFKNKRLCIFAVYCPDGRISDSQIYYLKGLKRIADNIIFIADSLVFPEEIEKIKDLVCYCNFERHKGFDFMSYKLGYEYALKNGLLDDINELIICNDSCYAPVFPFEKVFCKMAGMQCDFWGMTSNGNIQKHQKIHIQSFFYVFKKNIFKSDVFKSFIKKIKCQKNINRVIQKYEIEFTDYLVSHNFKYSTFVPDSISEVPLCINKTIYPLTLLENYIVPLVKVKVFNNKFLGKISEDSFETLDFIKSVNPELAEIIKKENHM